MGKKWWEQATALRLCFDQDLSPHPGDDGDLGGGAVPSLVGTMLVRVTSSGLRPPFSFRLMALCVSKDHSCGEIFGPPSRTSSQPCHPFGTHTEPNPSPIQPITPASNCGQFMAMPGPCVLRHQRRSSSSLADSMPCCRSRWSSWNL